MAIPRALIKIRVRDWCGLQSVGRAGDVTARRNFLRPGVYIKNSGSRPSGENPDRLLADYKVETPRGDLGYPGDFVAGAVKTSFSFPTGGGIGNMLWK